MSTKHVIVISDSTGETAERMLKAAKLQFGDTPMQITTYSRVRLDSECDKIISHAADVGALVVFTVVNREERDHLLELVESYGVPAVDLMGALMSKLASYLEVTPQGVPGLMHTLGEEYFRRIEAVEFAVKNDDGAEPRNLPKADIVLVGISRTSKTPLSTYLAQRGLKVANVPLVLGIDPPEELQQVEDRRVYGLIIQSDSLMHIRRARLKHLGMPDDASYGQRQHIDDEIKYSQQVFRRYPNWPVIDVTNRAIEETAADILRMHRERVSG